jgi:XTP/dITP diphosphohydrolase
MKLLFASQNKHKIDEVSKIVPKAFQILGLGDFNFNEDIPETKLTIEGNALQKASYIKERFDLPCFADDTGLFIGALGGEPGIYSARWSKNDARYSTNIEKALGELKGQKNRKAYFKTVIAFVDENNESHFFEGRIDGRIIEKEKGNAGFGYDPIFIPEGKSETFAEMSSEEKNKISHRGLAMNRFINYLKSITP